MTNQTTNPQMNPQLNPQMNADITAEVVDHVIKTPEQVDADFLAARKAWQKALELDEKVKKLKQAARDVFETMVGDGLAEPRGKNPNNFTIRRAGHKVDVSLVENVKYGNLIALVDGEETEMPSLRYALASAPALADKIRVSYAQSGSEMDKWLDTNTDPALQPVVTVLREHRETTKGALKVALKT